MLAEVNTTFHGVDTCRLIDFPVVASGQLPQPFREWLGEANNRMLFFNLYRKVKLQMSTGRFFDRTIPFWGFHGSSEVLQTLLVAPPSWIQDGGAGNDVNQDLGRPFRSPLWRWRKMAALPLPAAILDDLIPGPGNWEWGHPRWRPEAEGPPSCATATMGIEKAALYYSKVLGLPADQPDESLGRPVDL